MLFLKIVYIYFMGMNFSPPRCYLTLLTQVVPTAVVFILLSHICLVLLESTAASYSWKPHLPHT